MQGEGMKRHIGSTIALVFGVLGLVAGLARPGGLLIAGPIMILGALAYRSAKKRKLGEANQLKTRQVLELGAIFAILALILFQNNLKELIAADPVPHLVIPAWAIIAYAIVTLSPKKSSIMRRLNLWQRLGIVLSVLWALGAGFYLRSHHMNQAKEFAHTMYAFCLQSTPKPGDCFEKFSDNLRSRDTWLDVGDIAALAFIPIPLAWPLIYIVLWVTRWVLVGRNSPENSN
jgi:multisubunit Na+/H+ antiporter MnhB subunit